jgi:hypothetical protein
MKISEHSSFIPLGIFVVSAIFVYLCNRPRKIAGVGYARNRRRNESSRSAAR